MSGLLEIADEDEDEDEDDGSRTRDSISNLRMGANTITDAAKMMRIIQVWETTERERDRHFSRRSK